jgi:hypothetical protein
MLERLYFNPADPDALLDGHMVGSYLLSADGTAVTHTVVGAKKAIDVNIAGGVSLEVGLDAAADSVSSWTKDGSGNAITSTAGALNVHIANTVLDVAQDAVWIVDDPDTQAILSDILTELQGISSSGISVDLDAFTLTPDNVMIVGTIDGQKTGAKYGFVNNIRQQILSSHDRMQSITYADFGTKDQRVTQIDYTSPTFPGFTARKMISYTLVSNRYRRDTINWSIV